jgi:hypothetical protein
VDGEEDLVEVWTDVLLDDGHQQAQLLEEEVAQALLR